MLFKVAAGYEQPRDVQAAWDDGAPANTPLVAAHTARNRVDIRLSALDCPPPAHTTKVDITGYTYIVRNNCCSYDAAATDVF